MKTIIFLSVIFLGLAQGCDRSKGKGSDREWQERQEDIQREEDRQIDEKSREVRFTP